MSTQEPDQAKEPLNFCTGDADLDRLLCTVAELAQFGGNMDTGLMFIQDLEAVKARLKPADAQAPAQEPEAQQLESARTAAHCALDAAEKAWYAYAGLCDVGPARTQAFEVYSNVRLARRI